MERQALNSGRLGWGWYGENLELPALLAPDLSYCRETTERKISLTLLVCRLRFDGWSKIGPCL